MYKANIAFRVVIVILSLFYSYYAFSDVITDKAWSDKKLSNILNSNLALNGYMEHRYTDLALENSEKIAPCWIKLPGTSDSNADFKNIANNINYIHVRAIQYLFKGNEHDYTIVVRGDFSNSSITLFQATLCSDSCKPVDIKLSRLSGNQYFGTMQPGPKHSYISRFLIGISGDVKQIDSLSVTNSKTPNLKMLKARDKMSLGLCDEPKGMMIGEVKLMDLFFLILLPTVLIMTILFLYYKGAYFEMLLVITFGVTNAFGLIFLYFGTSQIRLGQLVDNRTIISTLAIYNLLSFIALVSGYYFFIKNSIIKNLDRYKKYTYYFKLDYKLVLSVFSIFSVFMILSHIDFIMHYYTVYFSNTDGHGFRAAKLRAISNANSLHMKTHYFRLLFIVLPLLLNLYLVNLCMLRRKYLLIIPLFIMGILNLLYNGEKAPVVWYVFAVLYLALISDFLNKNLFLSLMGVIFILSMMILYLSPMNSIGYLLDRTFLGANTVSYYMLKLFPSAHQFLEGDSLSFLGKTYSSNYFNLDLYLWRHIFSSSYYSSLTGTASGAIWTQGYANFGIGGLLLFSFVFGSIVSAVYNVANNIFPRQFSVPFSAFLVFHYSSFGETNLTRFIGDFYLIGIILILTCLACINQLLLYMIAKDNHE